MDQKTTPIVNQGDQMMNIQEQIERQRRVMLETARKKGMSHPSVLKASQKLDRLIFIKMACK